MADDLFTRAVDQLNRLRTAGGYSISRIAQASGIPRSTLSDLFLERRTTHSAATIAAVREFGGRIEVGRNGDHIRINTDGLPANFTSSFLSLLGAPTNALAIRFVSAVDKSDDYPRGYKTSQADFGDRLDPIESADRLGVDLESAGAALYDLRR